VVLENNSPGLERRFIPGTKISKITLIFVFPVVRDPVAASPEGEESPDNTEHRTT